MPQPDQGALHRKIVQAAEAVLAQNRSVGPLELFQQIGWLQHVHIEGWRKGHEHFPTLETWIQVGPEKFAKALRFFGDWARQRGLEPVEADYVRRTPQGVEQLRVTAHGDPEREKFYRTHYAPSGLSLKQATRLKAKLAKIPDLIVYHRVRDGGTCHECGAELGQFNTMEKGEPLCLTCADLDQLLFLPAGDAALSRRARKESPLSAVVVRFNRARKRYERQGLLVTADALDKAKEQCAADSAIRAATRAHAASQREAVDRELVADMTQSILRLFPSCPLGEAHHVAVHTAARGSGRVGRSAAGRSLDPEALQLAVQAHVRHQHTNYDALLMEGADRSDARSLVRDEVNNILARWRQSPGAENRRERTSSRGISV